MTTPSTMRARHHGQEFGTGLDDRLLNGAAQFGQACARSAARAVQAVARRHRKQRDMRQVMKDVDADGIPELVYGGEGQMRYAKPSRANPTGTWEIHSVSERGLADA